MMDLLTYWVTAPDGVGRKTIADEDLLQSIPDIGN
jgi:hypothetical protein